MANKSLTDLTARTATADSDLLHINSEGTDYKETKIDFLQGNLLREFSNTTSLTAQVDALPSGTYYGYCAASGHQSETGAPVNGLGYVDVQKLSNNSIIMHFQAVSSAIRYYKKKAAGTWDSSWTQEPARDEITSLNNSLTQLLKTGIFTKSSPATNVSAGSQGNFTVPITVPSGYTLVGVIAYSGSGTSGFSYSDIYKAGDNITVYYRNNNTETRSISSFSVTVLFVKTGFISSV